jgi:hypothetical protein
MSTEDIVSLLIEENVIVLKLQLQLCEVQLIVGAVQRRRLLVCRSRRRAGYEPMSCVGTL